MRRPEEILPGVLHWRAHHPDISLDVSSYFLVECGMALDPLLPAGEGPEWIGHEVRHVVLTIGLHDRSAAAFGLPIRLPREGLHRWEGTTCELAPFDDGDELAPGVRAIRVGEIAPDDYVLHATAGGGLVAVADAVFNYSQRGFVPEEHEGAYPGIGFAPDDFIGDDPEGVNRRNLKALERLLELDWDALLFAHGSPIPRDGKAALRAFVEGQA